MKRIACLAVCVFFLAAATGASAAELQYVGALNGAQESPSVTTTGVGDVMVTIDTVALTMLVETTFTGLMSGTTAAHIHCCFVPGGPSNVGVATAVPTFPGFPLGVTEGNYVMSFDLNDAATYNPDFVTANGGTVSGAMTALLNGLADKNAYFNIHTEQNPTGEIRDFLVPCNPQPIPEPGLALLAFIASGLVLTRRA
jgi:hypothetical protein